MNDSTSGKAERLEALFHQALDLAPDLRESFLVSHCGDDPHLLAQLRALLSSDSHPAPDWESPAIEILNRVPDRIGAYRILEEVSSGGMGTVYRAVRGDDEYRQQVAIKVIRAGMDSSAILRRFRQERQILASLEHPNIARLLDGGTTHEGLPFLVMEFIDGEPVTDFAEHRRLSTIDRLRLFLSVCNAVEYAHQKLVIHRDIKPGNILVTAEGVPKLLDFGIAKLIAEDTGETAATTAHFFTPEYASPEQVRQEPVTTSTDVYSLGVVLYRLLTGKSVYRVKSQRADEMAQAICTQEPERPSTVIARSTNAETVQLRRLLRGELDQIVLMALRKESSRRYASVAEFSRDIERYLDGRPVRAHADSFGYRARKFIGRNRLLVAASAVLAVSLIAGLFATMWQARIANQQRLRAESRVRDLRQLSNFLLFDVATKLETVPGTLAVRQSMIQRATDYLDNLAKDASGDSDLQAEIADAYINIGRMTFDVDKSVAALRKAVAISEKLRTDKPSIGAHTVRYAEASSQLADQLKQRGNMLEALEVQRAATAAVEKYFGPPSVEILQARVDVLMNAQLLESEMGNAAKALDISDRVMAEIEPQLKLDPVPEYYREILSPALSFRLRSLVDLERLDEALKVALRQDDWIVEGLKRDPSNAVWLRRRWASLSSLIRVRLMRGEVKTAEQLLPQCLSLIESLSRRDPADKGHLRGLAVTYAVASRVEMAANRPDAALARLQSALKISQSLLAGDPRKGETRTDLARFETQAAEIYGMTRQAQPALAAANRALDYFAPLIKDQPYNGRLRLDAAEAEWQAAQAADALHLSSEAGIHWSHIRDLLAQAEREGQLRPHHVPRLKAAGLRAPR